MLTLRRLWITVSFRQSGSSWGGLSAAGDCFPPLDGGILGRLAPMCREGGKEAWNCAGQAHRAAGGGGPAHLGGRLGILLQRGNAAILGNRVPNFPQAEVDGIERIFMYPQYPEYQHQGCTWEYQHQGCTWECFSTSTISELTTKWCPILKYIYPEEDLDTDFDQPPWCPRCTLLVVALV